MFKHILVPLDGSSLAERALPVAARIARTTGGTVTLFHVVNLRIEYGPYLAQAGSYSKAVLEADLASANIYLDRIAHSKMLEGVKMRKEVIAGLPVQTILVYARVSKVDLIVMASHGYTGFKRWALGSVAQKVARLGPMPVLIVRGDSHIPEPTTRPVRILVPLDSSPLAEEALLPAAQLCTALAVPAQGELHLVRVVQPLHHTKGEAAAVIAEMNEKATNDAWMYLSSIEQYLRGSELTSLHLTPTSSVISSSDVASTLIRAAEQGEHIGDAEECDGCDVIAMATHGRGGLERLLLGSIAERILGSTKLPLFVVHPQERGASKQSDEKVPPEIATI